MIVPLVIEQFLAIFIGMADTVMVSTVSESAVSAISLVDSINVLLIQLFSAMATGGAVVAAQYLGKHEPQNACTAAKQLMYVSLSLSLVLMTVSILFCDPILHMCFGNLSEGTMAYCRTYFFLSALSYPALALYNGGAALLRAMGNSKASMFTSFLMNILNVGGNAILIYGFHMEVRGAAIASLVSRVLGAAIMMKLMLDRQSTIHIVRPMRLEPDVPMIKRIFSQGIPNGLENSMFQIGKLLVTGVLAMFSESIIAANAVANNIASLTNLPGNAIGLAMVTVVGQCIGAGDTKQAKHYAIKLIKVTYLLMGISNLLLFLFAQPLSSIFSLSPEGIAAATEVLRFFAISASIFWTASFTLPNALRAAGDAKFTMTVSVFSMWVFRIGASYLLVYGFHMGLLGIWVAMAIDWVARAVLFSWRYRSGKWLTKKIV
ncbi:MAG: MATE family efflux transporter [Clostridia bacterium]